ncbi:MAG: halocyanin domain-containing protein [Haloferacaceae archaeon]
MRRRDFIRATGGGGALAAAAVGATGTAAAQPSFGGWMSGVGNYSSVADQTGKKEVTVKVGTKGNGGNFAFDPPAVQVDPGTKVTWEWTGEGGQHTVTAQSGGDFDSGLIGKAGATFSQTFDSEGVVKYYCTPHKSLGMKGVVVVGSMPSEGGGGESSSGPKPLEDYGVPLQAHWVGSATILGIITTLVYTFYVLKYGETPHSGHGGGE